MSEIIHTRIGKLHKRFPSTRHFTAALKTDDGRYWVPVDELESLIPDAEKTAWVLDETKQVLLAAAEVECRGATVIWQREQNLIQTVSTVQDGQEIAEALSYAARQHRNPAFLARRRLVDLGS